MSNLSAFSRSESHSESYYHSSVGTTSTLSVNGSYTSESTLKPVICGLPALPPLEPGPQTTVNVEIEHDHSSPGATAPCRDMHKGRSLVLCFDGTGDSFDDDNSNVVEFFSALKKDDPTRQLVYYQAGIGTYNNVNFFTPLAAQTSKFFDTAVAWNLGSHIMDGYKFLMQNYRSEDRICIFGFSRGAYTARCLAGMIHKVGIIPPWNSEQVVFAYNLYMDTSRASWTRANAFRRAMSTEVDIAFLGVWDTVESVGWIPKTKPFAASASIVRYFRHALALDERRAKFKANTWNYMTSDEDGLDGKNPANLVPSDVKEVWFAGCHCDVGGGSVANTMKISLARIPLRWMIRECFKTQSGIVFYADRLQGLGMEPDGLCTDPSQIHPPKIPSGIGELIETPCSPEQLLKAAVAIATALPEKIAGLSDALSPHFDQLYLKWWWGILETLPLTQRYQNEVTNAWEYIRERNMGSGRVITPPKSVTPPSIDDDWTERIVEVHRSVKTRLEARYKEYRDPKTGDLYVPRAQVDGFRIEWRDANGKVHDEPVLVKLPRKQGWFAWMWKALGCYRDPFTPPPGVRIRVKYVD